MKTNLASDHVSKMKTKTRSMQKPEVPPPRPRPRRTVSPPPPFPAEGCTSAIDTGEDALVGDFLLSGLTYAAQHITDRRTDGRRRLMRRTLNISAGFQSPTPPQTKQGFFLFEGIRTMMVYNYIRWKDLHVHCSVKVHRPFFLN